MIKNLTFIIIFCFLFPYSVIAQRTFFPVITDENILFSAQMCYVESMFSDADCIAELHIIRKRSTKIGFIPMIYKYSALDANNPRAREARTYIWGDIENKPKEWNKSWAKLRNLVVRVLSGSVSDTCHGAIHWGSVTDKQKQYQVPIRCSEKVHNIYYKVSKS